MSADVERRGTVTALPHVQHLRPSVRKWKSLLNTVPDRNCDSDVTITQPIAKCRLTWPNCTVVVRTIIQPTIIHHKNIRCLIMLIRYYKCLVRMSISDADPQENEQNLCRGSQLRSVFEIVTRGEFTKQSAELFCLWITRGSLHAYVDWPNFEN